MNRSRGALLKVIMCPTVMRMEMKTMLLYLVSKISTDIYVTVKTKCPKEIFV